MRYIRLFTCELSYYFAFSAAINLGGEIIVDGVAVETGVRMDLNLHTSTGSDVTFRVLDGRGVDVKVGLPLPKQEILSVKTQFSSLVRDDAQALTSTPIKYDTPRYDLFFSERWFYLNSLN